MTRRGWCWRSRSATTSPRRVRINDEVGEVFEERQIFRIDHYLGKETVQNLLGAALRQLAVRAVWNRPHRPRADHRRRDRGRRGRAAATTTSPARCATWCRTICCSCCAWSPWSRRRRSTANAVRDEKLKVLRASLRHLTDGDALQKTVRGQYRAGCRRRHGGAGLRRGAGRADSRTETFVALKAEVENWRWAGVPFYLRTGKRHADAGLGDRDPVQPGAALDLPATASAHRAEPAGHPPAAGRGHAARADGQGPGPRRHAPAHGAARHLASPTRSRSATPTPMSAC